LSVTVDSKQVEAVYDADAHVLSVAVPMGQAAEVSVRAN